MTPLPDCAWCSAASTLEEGLVEMGQEYYRCSCCAKITRVDEKNRAHRCERRKTDVSGNLMDDP